MCARRAPRRRRRRVASRARRDHSNALCVPGDERSVFVFGLEHHTRNRIVWIAQARQKGLLRVRRRRERDRGGRVPIAQSLFKSPRATRRETLRDGSRFELSAEPFRFRFVTFRNLEVLRPQSRDRALVHPRGQMHLLREPTHAGLERGDARDVGRILGVLFGNFRLGVFLVLRLRLGRRDERAPSSQRARRAVQLQL